MLPVLDDRQFMRVLPYPDREEADKSKEKQEDGYADKIKPIISAPDYGADGNEECSGKGRKEIRDNIPRGRLAQYDKLAWSRLFLKLSY